MPCTCSNRVRYVPRHTVTNRLADHEACILGGGRLSARVAPAQKDWVDRVQERITATSAMLADMKSVKMLGLTGALCQIISELRRIELKTSERFRTLLSSTIVICK